MDQISLAPSTAALASLVKIMDCIKVGTVKLATRIDQIEGIIAPSLVIGTVAWACMVTAVQMMVAQDLVQGNLNLVGTPCLVQNLLILSHQGHLCFHMMVESCLYHHLLDKDVRKTIGTMEPLWREDDHLGQISKANQQFQQVVTLV